MNTLAAVAVAICFHVLLVAALSLTAYGLLRFFWRSCAVLAPSRRAGFCAGALLAPPAVAALLTVVSFGRPDGPHDWCRRIQHFCFDHAEQQGFCLLLLGIPAVLAAHVLAVAVYRVAISLMATVRLNRVLSRQFHAPSSKLLQAMRSVKGQDQDAVPVGETDGAKPLSLVFGIRHPRCLFTHSLVESMTEAELAGVIAHELAHVHRRDNLHKLALRLAAALQWTCPWVATLMRQWQLEIELACDERAADLTGDPRSVATALMKVAQPGRGVAAPTACFAVLSGFCEAGQAAVRVRVERLVHLSAAPPAAGSTSAPMCRYGWAGRALWIGSAGAALLMCAILSHRLLAPSVACLADNLLRHGR